MGPSASHDPENATPAVPSMSGGGHIGAGIGLAYGTVDLAAPSHVWAKLFAQLAAELTPLLDRDVFAIEHVGSTAVVGLAAKPIIDIAAGLAPGADAEALRTPLAGADWLYRGDKGDAGLLFVREPQPGWRIAHLHCVPYGGTAWEDYLRFRDLLRFTDQRSDVRDVRHALFPGAVAQIGQELVASSFTLISSHRRGGARQ